MSSTTSIALTQPVRAALLTLQTGAVESARASGRLASGLEVERTLDDPTAFFTAQALNGRAQALNGLLDGLGQAREALATADHARTGIGGLLDQMDALLAEAAATDVETLPLDAASGLAEVVGKHIPGLTLASDHRHPTANVNWHKLDIGIDGQYASFRRGDYATMGDLKAAVDAHPVGVTLTIENERVVIRATRPGAMTTSRETVDTFGLQHGVTWPGAPATRSVRGHFGGFAPTDDLRDTGAWTNFLVRDGVGGEVYYRVGLHGSKFQDALDRINAVHDAGNFAYRADLTPDGRFRLTSTQPTASLSFSNKYMATRLIGLGSAITNATTSMAPTAPVLVREDVFHARYEALSRQIDQLAADASYGGLNLAMGERLSVAYNEAGDRLEGALGRIDTSGLVLSAVEEGDFITAEGRAKVEAALAKARTRLIAHAQRGQVPQAVLEVRETFSRRMADILTSGAADLTLADPNAEGARLLAVDTRLRLASEALGLATRADQGVLALFR